MEFCSHSAIYKWAELKQSSELAKFKLNKSSEFCAITSDSAMRTRIPHAPVVNKLIADNAKNTDTESRSICVYKHIMSRVVNAQFLSMSVMMSLIDVIETRWFVSIFVPLAGNEKEFSVTEQCTSMTLLEEENRTILINGNQGWVPKFQLNSSNSHLIMMVSKILLFMIKLHLCTHMNNKRPIR